MSNRPKIPSGIEHFVLTKSRRRCCLCFWLEGIDEVQKGQIAHLNENHSNHNKDNLAFLCLKHHDEYDSISSQSKGLTIKELKSYRKELYLEMDYRLKNISDMLRIKRVKNNIRLLAKEALETRIKDSIDKKSVLDWNKKTSEDLLKISGDPILFDFENCLEGAGEIDLETQNGLKAFLNIKARFLKDFANRIDITDINEI